MAVIEIRPVLLLIRHCCHGPFRPSCWSSSVLCEAVVAFKGHLRPTLKSLTGQSPHLSLFTVQSKTWLEAPTQLLLAS